MLAMGEEYPIPAEDIEILEAKKSDVGCRSWAYFTFDLEPKYPRKVVFTEKWMGPESGEGPAKELSEDVFEDDIQYLTRLNLLYDFEKAILKVKPHVCYWERLDDE